MISIYIDSYITKLKEHQLKITPKRKAILELFFSKNHHMGPYEVYKALKKKLPTIGLPTVYRILSEFKDMGILVQYLSKDCQLRYVLCTMPDEHHHHFTCRKCKKVEEIDFCNFKNVSKFIEKNLNAKVEKHELEIEGLCSACR